MPSSSRPPFRWTDAPPARAESLARPVVAFGSLRGRLANPRAARLAERADLAWALCAPAAMPPSLTAWDPRSARVAWRYDLARPGVFDVSADGAVLVFTDASGWCVCLDAVRGVERASFRDAPGEPDALVVARDGRSAVIARGGRVRRWDLDARMVTHDLEGFAPVALSADARTLACTRAAQRTAVVTHLDAGVSVTHRAARGARITALDLGPDDALVLGHEDGTTIRIAGGARRVTAAASGSPVTVVRAHGSLVASGHDNGETRVQPADASAQAVYALGRVEAIAPSLGAALVREGNGAVLITLDPVERHDLRAGHTDAVTAVAIARDGASALTASRDGTLRLWNPATGATLAALEGHAGPVRALALSPDGRLAWSAGERDGLRTWDLDDRAERAHAPQLAGLDALVASPDGTRLVAQLAAGPGTAATALLLDARDGRVIARAALPSRLRGAIGFTDDGALALLSYAPLRDGGLRLTYVDARSGDDVRSVVVPAPRRACMVHRITADGHLATGTTERMELSVRDGATGAVRTRHAVGSSLLLHALAVVGRRYALGATSGTHIELCDLSAGERVALKLPHREDAVTALALAPDERWFVAGTAQGIALRYELRA